MNPLKETAEEIKLVGSSSSRDTSTSIVDRECHANPNPTMAVAASSEADAARAATDAEHGMKIWQAVKLYRWAVFYSVCISAALIMEGYDTALLPGFYALEAFNKRFGEPVGDGTYQLPPLWQALLQCGMQAGQSIGLLFAGFICDRVGYRKTLGLALVLSMCSIFIFVFCQNIRMLLAAEIVAGMPWGAFEALAATYASDIAPIPLRPILTTWVNANWALGQLIALGVLRGSSGITGEWSYRLPWALQWVWPIPILIVVKICPESPVWLVKNGYPEAARKSLERLSSGDWAAEDIERKLSMLVRTDEAECQEVSGQSYLELFRGTNLRRTEIACFVWIGQVVCGIWFCSNVAWFLRVAGGFSPNMAFNLGIATNAVAVVATIGSWSLTRKYGRRTLYLAGLIVMFLLLLVIGGLGFEPEEEQIAYTSAALMMLFVVTYDFTIGPIAYTLVSEMSSTRLRIKTVVVARISYNLSNIAASFANPQMLNPLAWDLGGKTGLVWAVTCLMWIFWTYFRLPEPKGLSPAELDRRFELKLSARQFRSGEVDAFQADQITPDEESPVRPMAEVV
ncbi:Maltose permease MAL61 [Cyphellophora attinorum]|uniref:Maltose permease MAL61 n=1 Tax=Cyphellophora attinorum TaxID=1664694 RepID=A0A0N1H4B2_9EURO|nr:Maltose permease MAL61 [Phialophora attinorum]KPI36810.1 Maltose permease MAL61 [Phialophora attinorum]